MGTGDKIARLRRERNITQEQLADRLEVSRQAVSKWESELAYPETDKLIRMSEMFGVTVDYLLKDNAEETPSKEAKTKSFLETLHYEYKSERTLFGLPLVHVNVGVGMYKAKGILSVGVLSTGIFSVGLLSIGLFAVGLLSLGLLALGVLSLGLLTVAAVAVGFFAVGAIAVGVISIGALSVGFASVGALSVGKYIALGDHAYAGIAIGITKMQGFVLEAFHTAVDATALNTAIESSVPVFFKPFVYFIAGMVA